MGIVKKVGLTGIGLIVAIVGISYLAKYTNVLGTVTSGLTNTGSALGRGIGGGLQNLFSGFWGGVSGLTQKELDNNWESLTTLGGLLPKAYADDGLSNAGDPTITPENREYYDDLVNQKITIGKYVPESRIQNALFTGKNTPFIRIPATISSAESISFVRENELTHRDEVINTVDIRLSSGYYSKPLVERLREAREKVISSGNAGNMRRLS